MQEMPATANDYYHCQQFCRSVKYHKIPSNVCHLNGPNKEKQQIFTNLECLSFGHEKRLKQLRTVKMITFCKSANYPSFITKMMHGLVRARGTSWSSARPLGLAYSSALQASKK